MFVYKSTRSAWTIATLFGTALCFPSTNTLAASLNSSNMSFAPEKNNVKMIQVQKAAHENFFSDMAAVANFYKDPSHKCKSINEESRSCYQIISIKLFTNTTEGSTQCPDGYTLAMATNNAITYVDPSGKTISDSTVSYTPHDEKDMGLQSTVTANQFYERQNNYTKTPSDKLYKIKSNQEFLLKSINKEDQERVCEKKLKPLNTWISLPKDIYMYLESYEIYDQKCANTNGNIKHCITHKFKCKYNGKGAKYIRPAGYYYNATRGPEQQYIQVNKKTRVNFSLPTPITNPLTGPSVAICVKDATATIWVQQPKL